MTAAEAAALESGTRGIIVRALHPSTNEESIRNFFTRYGPVADVRVMRHAETRESREFAFVEFATREVCSTGSIFVCLAL